MNILDIVYETVDINGGPLNFPDLEIECPECKTFYSASEWNAYDTDCDSCGSHPILKCPQDHFFDPFADDVKEFNTQKIE
jgi:Zn finger protein HypA/HybF involved in hydrogenase expression